MQLASIRVRLNECITNRAALASWQLERAQSQADYWQHKGCTSAKFIGESLRCGVPIRKAMELCPSLWRQDPSRIVQIPARAASHRMTSGSSGNPMRYGLSRGWRKVHRLLWNRAYQDMTEGEISSYLDDRYTWAMARPPGGSADNLPHLIECVPSRSGNVLLKGGGHAPHFIHGSITTILWMISDGLTKDWSPRRIFLTYEGADTVQLNTLRNRWPSARISIEYGANDGGIAGFTCPQGTLHYWSISSIPIAVDGKLKVFDLLNRATGFNGYFNGDEVDINENASCACGSAFPEFSVTGRTAKSYTLQNGSRISALCPFDADEMIGISSIRVLVVENDEAILTAKPYIDGPSRSRLTDKLISLGFTNVQILTWSEAAARYPLRNKFQVVSDARKYD